MRSVINAKNRSQLSETFRDIQTDAGYAFSAGKSESKAAAASSTAIFEVGASALKPKRFRLKVTSIDAFTVTLYEGAVYTSGTGITPINKNRNSAVTSVLTVKHTPTVAGGSEGTAIWSAQAYAQTVEFPELTLKASTKYYLVITNNHATDAKILSWIGEWVEHTDLG